MFHCGECNPEQRRRSGTEVSHCCAWRRPATVYCLNWVFCVKDAILSCMTNLYLFIFSLILAKGLRVDITQAWFNPCVVIHSQSPVPITSFWPCISWVYGLATAGSQGFPFWNLVHPTIQWKAFLLFHWISFPTDTVCKSWANQKGDWY